MTETGLSDSLSLHNQVINIEKLLAVTINLRSSTKDKLKETSEVLKKQTGLTNIPSDKFLDLVSKIIDSNRCTDTKARCFLNLNTRCLEPPILFRITFLILSN